jgi:hypothetical protein
MLKSSKYYVAKNYAISEFFELTHMLLEIILVCSPRDSLFESIIFTRPNQCLQIWRVKKSDLVDSDFFTEFWINSADFYQNNPDFCINSTNF